jgi:hypothetical protein
VVFEQTDSNATRTLAWLFFFSCLNSIAL